jgi:hypothetical protein
MPIKSFTFAFKIDAKDLLAYVVEKNIAVDIHATGTKRQEPEVVETIPQLPQPLALSAPSSINSRKPTGGRMGSKAVILLYLAANKRATPSQLKVALREAGYRTSTYNGLMFILKANKLVSGSAQGYRILNKGLKMLDTARDE